MKALLLGHIFLVMMLTACHKGESRHSAVVVKLPRSYQGEQAPVVTLVYHSRMIKNLGSIRVYSDGSVHDERLGKSSFGKLTEPQSAQLMRELDRAGFFTLNPENMRAEILREDPTAASVEYFGTPHLIDGTTVSLSVRSPSGSNTVSWYGLHLAVKNYPDIKEFKVLSDCITKVEEATNALDDARSGR